MTRSQVVIGLDVGTTAAKASVFALDGSVRFTEQREYPLLSPQAGWHVQDAETIAAGVLSALAAAVARADGAPVVAISVSSAMHGLLGLDRDRRPVTDILTWADSRAIEQAKRLARGPAGERLHRQSGTPVHAMAPLAKLAWFNDHDPSLLRSTPSWVGLKDWVLAVLTGQVVTELSTASGSGMADLALAEWSDEALELSGVRLDQLPVILDTTEVLSLAADAAGAIGLPAGTPVVAGAGDGPLGNLGTGAMVRGIAGLSIGTSGALRMAVPMPQVAPGLFCYALTRDVWVAGGAISNGGMVQRWLTATYAPGCDDAEACRRAEAIPAGSDGLVMIPYLVSERASLWDPDIRGAFIGVRRPHTPDHFIRAGVEGVAIQLWTILRRLRTITRVTEIRATGGVFRSPLWQQVVRGVLNRPTVVTGSAEGSGLGAAILGLVAVGAAESLSSGYDLLRGHEPEVRLEVSEADSAAYEHVRNRLPDLLEQYGDLSRTFV